MEQFTPLTSLAGGALIGLSAMLLLWANGRVAGINGVITGLFIEGRADWSWRLCFLLGLIIGGLMYPLIQGGTISIQITDIDFNWLTLVGGFIVGVGATLGSGCTSGHGICGIARFSPRSITATVTFMLTAFLTVFIVRHVL